MPIDDSKRLETYQKMMVTFGRQNLKCTTNIPTLDELINEGELLLKAEEKEASKTSSKKEGKRLEKKLGSMSSNPYIRARIEILNKMKEVDRKEIETMENTKDVNNRFYEDFVKQVRILGEKYESEN